DEYLAKPVDRLRLLHAVAHAMSKGERVAPRHASPSPVDAAEPEPARPYRLRVLLVDDDPDSLEVLSALLEAADVDVAVARSGAEALERAAQTHPEVIVLDLGLPDVDGYAVLEHLKQSETLRAARFIGLTGRTGREEHER